MGHKEEGHRVVATSKYGARAIEDDKDDDNANEEDAWERQRNATTTIWVR